MASPASSQTVWLVFWLSIWQGLWFMVYGLSRRYIRSVIYARQGEGFRAAPSWRVCAWPRLPSRCAAAPAEEEEGRVRRRRNMINNLEMFSGPPLIINFISFVSGHCRANIFAHGLARLLDVRLRLLAGERQQVTSPSRQVTSPAPAPACGSRVQGFGFRVSNFKFQISNFGLRVQGFRFRVLGFGIRVRVDPL